jgi:hypothetical protein
MLAVDALDEGLVIVAFRTLIVEDLVQTTLVNGHRVERCQDTHVFEFRFGGKTAGWLVCSAGYRSGTLYLSGFLTKAAVDNALMIQFAMASATLDTALFHAAAVSLDGKGYMFLGKSGTGKSTHARLWLQNIPGTELMNDDNPAVRVKADGTAVVYGTPWSGKTPCYRNISAPIGGIVLLSQAPFNKIVRLKGIGAYAAVVPSISGKRWDNCIADGLHEYRTVPCGGCESGWQGIYVLRQERHRQEYTCTALAQ